MSAVAHKSLKQKKSPQFWFKEDFRHAEEHDWETQREFLMQQAQKMWIKPMLKSPDKSASKPYPFQDAALPAKLLPFH